MCFFLKLNKTLSAFTHLHIASLNGQNPYSLIETLITRIIYVNMMNRVCIKNII